MFGFILYSACATVQVRTEIHITGVDDDRVGRRMLRIGAGSALSYQGSAQRLIKGVALRRPPRVSWYNGCVVQEYMSKTDHRAVYKQFMRDETASHPNLRHLQSRSPHRSVMPVPVLPLSLLAAEPTDFAVPLFVLAAS